MTNYRFFCGKGKSEVSALKEALTQCADDMLNFPSLVIELVEMTPNASDFEAHIRIMAISDNVGTKRKKKTLKGQSTLEIKPNDDLGRHEGVEHDGAFNQDNKKILTMLSFDLAVMDGVLPDIPTQDLDQFKDLGMSVEQVRLYLNNKQFILQQDLKLDKK